MSKMDIDKKLDKLEQSKTAIENQVIAIQQQINSLQQQLGTLNRDYLMLLGQIQAYEEMKNGQSETE